MGGQKKAKLETKKEKIMTEKEKNDMRNEIRSEIASKFDSMMGEQIVQKIFDRGYERSANLQKAAAVATAETEEAGRLKAAHEQRSTQLQAQLKELRAQVDEQQSALDALKAERAALTPQVLELRRERQEHIDRVKRALEKNS
jgi:hypothetical protein